MTQLGCSFLSWITLASIQTRQEFVCNGGDLLLRLTLFWSVFLPLGASFSLDSATNIRLAHQANARSQKSQKWAFSVASVGWLLQFGSMYAFTFGLKYGEHWWDGTAVAVTLQQEQFLTPTGHFVRSILFPFGFLPNSRNWLYDDHTESWFVSNATIGLLAGVWTL